MTPSELARFLPKIATDKDTGCWGWTAHCDQRTKYGSFTIGRKIKKAHRVAFEHWKGAIPSDKELDHLCRNRACVNPEHLEAVTHTVNVRRGRKVNHRADALRARRACKNGHPFNEANTYWMVRQGRRVGRRCRTCAKLKGRADRARTGPGRTYRFLTYQGETLTVCEWARRIGLSQSTLSRRLNELGWRPEDALSTPVERR